MKTKREVTQRYEYNRKLIDFFALLLVFLSFGLFGAERGVHLPEFFQESQGLFLV